MGPRRPLNKLFQNCSCRRSKFQSSGVVDWWVLHHCSFFFLCKNWSFGFRAATFPPDQSFFSCLDVRWGHSLASLKRSVMELWVHLGGLPEITFQKMIRFLYSVKQKIKQKARQRTSFRLPGSRFRSKPAQDMTGLSGFPARFERFERFFLEKPLKPLKSCLKNRSKTTHFLRLFLNGFLSKI